MMNFKQNLTVLFWLYRQKAKADGKAPVYARITIDGSTLPETYEFWLARLPEASFGIRLNDSQVSKLDWMNQPQGFRAIGFAEQMQQFGPSDIVKNYDVLLFVKSVVPKSSTHFRTTAATISRFCIEIYAMMFLR